MSLKGNSPAIKVKALVCALTLAAAAFAPGVSLARGPGDGRGGGPGPDRGWGSGGYVRHLPPGHRHTNFRGHRYYYNHGRFYRPGPRGYIRVGPPIGAIVAALPINFATLVVGGFTYYSYLGVYYQRVPSGYVVVETPPTVVTAPPVVVAPAPGIVQPSTASSGSVQVTAASLNVRQGPGFNYGVITVTYAGDVLTVTGQSPGWLFVTLPDGSQGWVSQRFTNPVSSGASG